MSKRQTTFACDQPRAGGARRRDNSARLNNVLRLSEQPISKTASGSQRRFR
jgi:hypothetical protein